MANFDKNKEERLLRDFNRARDAYFKYTKLEKDDKLKNFIGKCFQYGNSYGKDCPNWFVYLKVLSVRDGAMHGIQFEHTSREIIEIQMDTEIGEYIVESGKEISVKLFNQKYEELVETIQARWRGI